jgi:hypothetical protein
MIRWQRRLGFTYATRTREHNVTEDQIYYRKQSPSQTLETARKQMASQEMWGGPPSNFLSSHIPKVQAFIHRRPLTADESVELKRIEFTTKVEPDRGCIPYSPSWLIDPNDPSTEREGLWNEDGYAKIKVKVTFCNQVE